jgi:hypothetical protein
MIDTETKIAVISMATSIRKEERFLRGIKVEFNDMLLLYTKKITKHLKKFPSWEDSNVWAYHSNQWHTELMGLGETTDFDKMRGIFVRLEAGSDELSFPIEFLWDDTWIAVEQAKLDAAREYERVRDEELQLADRDRRRQLYDALKKEFGNV